MTVFICIPYLLYQIIFEKEKRIELWKKSKSSYDKQMEGKKASSLQKNPT